MSEIKYRRESDNREVVYWPNIKAGDTCQELPFDPQHPFKTLHVEGTPGGSTLTWEGRNRTGETAKTVNSIDGLPLSFTTVPTGPQMVRENLALQGPAIADGDATAIWQVSVHLES